MKAVESWMHSLLLGTIVALAGAPQAFAPQACAAPLEAAAESYRHYLI